MKNFLFDMISTCIIVQSNATISEQILKIVSLQHIAAIQTDRLKQSP